MASTEDRVRPSAPRSILWHRRAIADLFNVSDWQTAARIDAEILYFAETGRGHVRRLRVESGPDELRLYTAPPWYVRFTYDRLTRTILVERVLRWRSPP